MEKTIVFLDYANINAAARRMNGVNYADLLNYLSEGRFLVEAYAYVPIDPRNEHGRDAVMSQLWEDGYTVISKVGTVAGDSYKCDCDVEMTMDLMRVAHVARPDIIVICSGDVDFLPVVHELRRMGIRVEGASFEGSASRRLMVQCSGFISLDQWLDGQYVDERIDLEMPQELEAEGEENHLKLFQPEETTSFSETISAER